MLFGPGSVGRQMVAGNAAGNIIAGASLNLNFMNAGLLPSGVVFTRASTATYFDSTGVMRTAAMNLACPSVNWFNNQPATSTQEGVTQSVGISPSGAHDAMALIPGAYTGVHQFYRTFGGAVSTLYTFSVYVKAAGMNFVALTLENSAFSGSTQTATFNLSNGTIDNQTVGAAAVITPVGNGWYRCTVSATSTASGGNYVNNVLVGPRSDMLGAVGDGVNGIWVWGQQVELGSTATTYAPTTTVANGAPRWDYDPVSHVLNGLLIEEARTNSARNSTMQGAVVGTPGTLPTGWLVAPNAGLTTSVVSLQTVNGIPTIDLRISGTTTSATYLLFFDAGVSAASTQVWTSSAWFAMTAGSRTNIVGSTLEVRFTGGSGQADLPMVPTPTLTRFSSTGTAGTGVTATNIAIWLNCNSGAAIDITLRIGAPQLELGAFATSYIPTTTVPVTRAVDTCSVPVAAIPGFSTTAGSMAHEYAVAGGYAPGFGAPIQLVGAATATDYINCDQATTISATPAVPIVSGAGCKAGGVSLSFANFPPASIPVGTIHRGASSWAVGNTMLSAHDGVGNTAVGPVAATMPTLISLTIGGQVNSQLMISQWARRTQYWPRQLPTAELQTVTR